MSSDSTGEGREVKSSLCDLEWTSRSFNRGDIHGLPKHLENQCSGEISFWAVVGGGEVNSGKRKLFKESCRKRFEVKNLGFEVMLPGFEPQLAPSSLAV